MPFQILSLSGGGYLGLYTISVLADLEDRIGARGNRFRPLSRETRSAASSPSASPARCLHSTSRRPSSATALASSRIVRRRAPTPPNWPISAALRSPKYDPCALRNTIIDIIGADTRIGHLKHPCIVPTVCLTKGGPQIFKTDHHLDFSSDHRLKAVDVALATSAAPSYFPIAEIDDGLYADGGLYANSPDLIALHEAEHFFKVPLDDIRLLSIGTTTSKFSFAHGTGTRFGILQWATGQRLVQAILSSQQQIVDNIARHRLGSRYVRLDIEQSREQEKALSLDTAHLDAQKTIRAMAAVTIRRVPKIIMTSPPFCPTFRCLLNFSIVPHCKKVK